MGSVDMIGVELGCEYRQRLANYCIEELVESLCILEPRRREERGRGVFAYRARIPGCA